MPFPLKLVKDLKAPEFHLFDGPLISVNLNVIKNLFSALKKEVNKPLKSKV